MRRIMDTMAYIALALIALVIFGAATGCAVQRRILFPRHITPSAAQRPARPAGVEQLWLDTSQGRVEAWFVPGRGVAADAPGPAILYAHGNAELIDFCVDDAARYAAMGVSVLLVEYRGYGRSAGRPTEARIIADCQAFYDLLIARPDVRADAMVFHGRSLGGAVLSVLSQHRRPAALIVQSSFTSVKDVARDAGLPTFLVFDKFDARAAIAQLDVPVLILHGDCDEIIPFAHAQALHAAARNAKLVSLHCGHNDPPPAEPFWNAIESFLAQQGIISDAAR